MRHRVRLYTVENNALSGSGVSQFPLMITQCATNMRILSNAINTQPNGADQLSLVVLLPLVADELLILLVCPASLTIAGFIHEQALPGATEGPTSCWGQQKLPNQFLCP